MNPEKAFPPRHLGLPPRPPRYIGSSFGTKNVPMRLDEQSEPLHTTIPPQNLDMISAVNELHRLSATDIGKLIDHAENGVIKLTRTDESTFQLNVESLARYLAKHVMEYSLSFKLDEEHLRYLLSGIRVLHILCNLAPHSPKLKRVLFDNVSAEREIFDLIFSMTTLLGNLRTEIQGLSGMALLYSTLLASSLYLLTSFISSEFNIIAPALLAHRKVNQFTDSGLTSVRVVISFLQVNLSTISLNSQQDKVYCLFETCEASLQFFQSLCKQRKFRKHLELRDENVVLQLVQDILRLPQCQDSRLMEVVYRLKSKVLFIMLCLCEVENSTFLVMSSSTTKLLESAFATIYEVLEVIKMMFSEDFQDHPQGLLYLNALRIIEIFSDDSNFRSYIVLYLTDALTKVFTLPHDIFLASWCSSDPKPAEKEIVKVYDSLAVSAQVLDVNLARPERMALSTNLLPQFSYACQRSALLVKIVAHLSCFVPDLSQEENGHFINEFLECLKKEISNLPDAAARAGGEITASLNRNLHSFMLYARFLVPHYLDTEDVNIFGMFCSKVERNIDRLNFTGTD